MAQKLSLPSERSFNLNGIFLHQLFPLPPPLIRYICKNCSSPKVWKKLIQTCRFFYTQHPIYPVCNLEAVRGKKIIADGKLVNFDMDFSKIWLRYGLNVDKLYERINLDGDLFSSKIMKCQLQYFRVAKQNLSWEEYDMLTSSGTIKVLHLKNCNITYSNGSSVTFDKLVEKLQSLQEFEMSLPAPSMFESDTVMKTVQILSQLKNLRKFSITELPETFEFSSIVEFLMTNRAVKFELTYNFREVLTNDCKEILFNFMKAIIDNPLPKEQIPIISFPGLDNATRVAYFRLRGGAY